MLRQLIALILLLAISTFALGHDPQPSDEQVLAWLEELEPLPKVHYFAPWNMAKIAIFYPEPFGRTPHWPEHFIAYVRGAHLIKTLPDVHATKTVDHASTNNEERATEEKETRP